MKRKILLLIPIIVSLFTITNLDAQWINASLQSNIYNIKDMGFFKSKTGIVLSEDTSHKVDVRRTINGGQSWTAVNMSNFKNDLFNTISTVNTTIGFAGGNQLIKTTDAGATWDSVSNISFSGVSRSQVYFYTMTFVNETVGFALLDNNNVIFKTTDGGKTWTGIDTSAYTTRLYALDANNIYALSNGGIIYSNDGESTWKKTPSTSFGNRTLNNVLFLSSNNGYITGDFGNLFHTTDGGATWNQPTLDTAVNLFDIQFLDANDAIISAAADITFSSTDGGTTWKHHYEPDPNGFFLYDLQNAYFFDKDNGAAMYSSLFFNELLYNTHLSSGIHKVSENTVNLDIYPNPSTGLINIRTNGLKGAGVLSVFNSTGKVVFKENVEGDSYQALSLSNYGKGFYTIEITTENAIGHQQIIIE